jgi:hypothetical protein
MLHLARRLWAATRIHDVTYCEPCGQACTPGCRSAARLDRARTDALRRTLVR